VDEKSVWKKEISFRRKPKQPKQEQPQVEEPKAAAEAEASSKPTSFWKKDVSFKRSKKEGATDAVAPTEPIPAEPTFAEPTFAEPAVAAGDAEPKKSVWKREISLRRKPKDVEAVVLPESQSEAHAEPDVPVAPELHAVADVRPDDETHGHELSAVETSAESEAAEPVTVEPTTAEIPHVSLAPPPVELASVPDQEQPSEIGLSLVPALDEPASATESWSSEPALPPEPIEHVPVESAALEPTAVEPVAVELTTVEHSPVEPVLEPAPVPHEPQAVEPIVQDEPEFDQADVEPPAVPVAEAVAIESATEAAHAVRNAVDSTSVEESKSKGDKPVPFWRREIAIGRRKPATVAAAAVTAVGAAEVPDAGDDEPKRKSRKAKKAEKAPKTKAAKSPKLKRDRGGRGKKVVGLKIGASQLAAARVSNNGAAELLQIAREPLSSGIVVGGELRDPDALAAALKAFFTKHKLPKRGVRLGIANNRIGVRTFDLPGIEDEKQLGNAIRFRAQETLPIPIDEAVLDYQVLGESTDENGETVRKILLIVAYREQIDRYIEACKKAGIALVGIDLEAFALLRALQAPQDGAAGDPSAALVAVAIGHERATLAVSDGRVCEFTRVLEWGGSSLNVALARALDAAPSEVEGVKRKLSLGDTDVPEGLTEDQAAKARDAISRSIQAFARELVSSLQFYQNQPGSLGIGEIVLTGGTATLPGLAGELERLIGVHVRVGDPLARMKVSKKVEEDEQIGSLAVAIGLGIED